MKVNKILALIGSIVYSLIPLAMFVFGAGVGFIASNSDVRTQFANQMLENGTTNADLLMGSGLVVLATLFFILAVISLGIAIVNWIAFTRIQTPKEKPWKMYYLIIGILSALIGLPFAFFWGLGLGYLISGVLFILVFALRGGNYRMTASHVAGFEGAGEGQNRPFPNQQGRPQGFPPNPNATRPQQGNQPFSESHPLASGSQTAGFGNSVEATSPVVDSTSQRVSEPGLDGWSVAKNGEVRKESSGSVSPIDSAASDLLNN